MVSWWIRVGGTRKYFCWRWRKVYGCELTPEQEHERAQKYFEECRQKMIAWLVGHDESYRGRIESWSYERVQAEQWRVIRSQIRAEGLDPDTGEPLRGWDEYMPRPWKMWLKP